ncbi:DEAD/DEAH box helicase [Morganella morganii]|uniref:DEAD/DEAH box helicase n=1 Tax=Morganella morganii TaxID=582 RepID=UPI0015F4AB79|nr:DEAD/DEAH box helicase [Morganella morganii]MBA5836577.1 ATP-dependent helicase [Morganella morganii]MBV0430534.1 DEAD/DEAH box helicase family protein [Morganella morganii subsp. morganii]HCR4155048.1 DEAD/DEAH box helicase family protein [Morganella morganii]
MLSITPKAKQVTALNMLRRNWNQHRTMLLSASVGFGKTAIAAFMTAGLVSHNQRVMFVAPYTVLLDQTASRFVEYGLPAEEISFVWRDHPLYDPTKLIQIASADTLIRRQFPDNIDLLIIDEAHMKRKKILEIIRDSGVRVVGLSGTPFAGWMGEYYETLIKPTTMKELISIGDLSRYEFYAPDNPDVSGVKTTRLSAFGNDYNEDQLAQIMGDSDLVGNIVKFWLENGEDRPTVCFCVNVSHANFVTMEFNRAGINAEVMTADTPHDERQLIINRFETGATKIIVNVGVLVAGFDSDVRCIIYARPTKSEIRWVQCLGRGLRTAPGKDKCLIFDHSGSVHLLGFPDEIEYDDLQNKNDGMKTQSSYRDQVRAEKKPKECPSCHYMKPAGVYVCPKCGFKPLMGENVQVDETRDLKKLNAGEQIFTKEQKQSWWSQIKFYQKQREISGKPISDGWCAHTYKKKFGVWPRGLHDSPQEMTPEVSNYIRSKNIAFAKMQEKQKKSEEPKTEAEKKQIALNGIAEIKKVLNNGGHSEDSRGSARAMA